MSRKRHNVDREATEAANFLDRGGRRKACRSYITHKGEHFLFGPDKSLLRAKCFLRDRFTCTECGEERDAEDLDMHHVIPLGKGGDDSLGNVTTLCKWTDCHKKKHRRLIWSGQERANVKDIGPDKGGKNEATY